MISQSITSADTSVKQLPSIFRLINKTMNRHGTFWNDVRRNLDIGGGKYDLLTDKLKEIGIENYILDPYNRSNEHNLHVVSTLEVIPADIAICSNVLNVVREVEARNDIHVIIRRLVTPNANVFFTVYEGDASSIGRKTLRGWQANRPTKNYVRELRRHYENVSVYYNKLIVCDGFK